MNCNTQLLEKATLNVFSELPFPFEKEPILSESDQAWLEQEETWERKLGKSTSGLF